ncbi:putative kinetochore protein spc24 [Friedmanniomyces endolithicus]|nr:putative kinetochore protein spc24 [Friedmanniomyces endolithicus]
MVLFDDDPVNLIRETTTQFHIPPDRAALTRISTSLSDLQSARQSRLATQHSTLQSLSRRLNSLQSSVGFEAERHDGAGHAAEMLRMDREKFRVGKGVCEAEGEGGRLGAELVGRRVELEGLEREGVEGGRRVGGEAEDEVVLKLQFYRSLGIDVSRDATTGDYNRAVVRSTSRGDVNVVNVDGKLSGSFYAKLFWDSL